MHAPSPPQPSECPCCTYEDAAYVGHKRGDFLKRDFFYFRCRQCACLWVEPFPGYEVYNEDYFRGRGPDPFVDYASEYADYRATDRHLEFQDLWRIASRHFPTNGSKAPIRWLDFGCGAGGFLKFLRDQPGLANGGHMRPLQPHGHDIGPYSDRLKAIDGFPILSTAELASESEGFDIVTCIEVVEHVKETRDVFATLAQLLKPGGLLIVTTGNIKSAAARMAGLNYRYLLPEIHVRLLNPGCLDLLYRQNRLESLPVRYRGVVQFKVIKSIRHPLLKQLARAMLNLPLVTRAIDAFYGVSAMPCALKPIGGILKQR